MDPPLIVPRDLEFLLWDWLRLDQLLARPKFAGHDRGTVTAVLDLSLRVAADRFLPHYKDSDRNEPQLDDAGDVRILPAIGAALRDYAGLGLFGAGFDEEVGGMQLPCLVATASMAQFMAANIATAAYIMLTVANARLIVNFGTPAQIFAFAHPQIAGDSFGTMCLSEPQAGSSLADVRTRARPDGECALGHRYRLAGNKMWISGGDQDVSDNIIHLVLARTADADGAFVPGTGGISLFIVPKWLPGDAGRNDLAVAGLNHKMGYRGTSNCLLNFGEGAYRPEGRPGAIGYLVGREGQGLALMFQMMNEARINVGLGAAALGYRGYRHALLYARERLQGRPLDAPKGSVAAPVPIIDHADVRRMLLAQKAYAEGALALVLYCAALVDRPDDDESVELLALLTPVAKSWPSEWALAANDLAIQVHGGYGYTRDFDVEQLYRDNRLNPIHEGTTGIQALDLLGRKLLRGTGQGLIVLRARVRDCAARARKRRTLALHAGQLEAAWAQLETVLDGLRRASPPARALENATPFAQAFAHIVLAWLWLDQALVCAAAEGDADFHQGKLRACRFFFECELPRTQAWLRFVGSASDVASGASPDQF